MLDENDYKKGKGDEISDTEIASINIRGDDFHPEWNYTISPRKNKEILDRKNDTQDTS